MAIKDLPENEQKTVRQLIRLHCKNLNENNISLYQLASAQGVGLEATEEAVENLLDLGKLVLVVYPERNTFVIKQNTELLENFI